LHKKSSAKKKKLILKFIREKNFAKKIHQRKKILISLNKKPRQFFKIDGVFFDRLI